MKTKSTPYYLWIDQWGNKFRARTRAELVKAVGGGRVSIMYRDKSDGRTVKCGLVVGAHWCSQYAPVETPA
jgi:hypothetical protein